MGICGGKISRQMRPKMSSGKSKATKCRQIATADVLAAGRGGPMGTGGIAVLKNTQGGGGNWPKFGYICEKKNKY